MEKIRTLIVDDEPLARDGIRVLLQRDSDFEIVGECATGEAAVESVRTLTPDLVFLDVQMPKMNGFEVVDRIEPNQAPVVIFVTAYDQYALTAFEHHALDYLLKPFDDERFDKTLQRAKKQLQQQQAHQFSRQLMHLMEDYRGGDQPSDSPMASGNRYVARLAIRSAGRVLFLKTCEIDWIEAADYYVKLHVGGKAHLLRQTMTNQERRLDPARFIRIHRSTIVNLERVKELRSQAQGEYAVCLDDGTRLRLSRSRKERLSELLNRG